MANSELKPGALDKPVRRTKEERMAARRDPNGWRTAAKVSKWGDPTFAAEKAAADRRETAVIAETRRQVWIRSWVCEACGDSERETGRKYWKSEHEMHEVRPRSLTRGLEPQFRFNTFNCARLCTPCHREIQHHVRRLNLLTAAGMDGNYHVEEKDEQGVWRAIRTIERGAA